MYRDIKRVLFVGLLGVVAGNQTLAVAVAATESVAAGGPLPAQFIRSGMPAARNVSRDEVPRGKHQVKTVSDSAWSDLESTTWVLDGKSTAPRVVYIFDDPSCSYCNRIWSMTRPWVDAGGVQLRHILVGVVKPDSRAKAAAILGATDQAAAMQRHEQLFESGGIMPSPEVSAEIEKALTANQALMTKLGFGGTPAIVYKDESGTVHRVIGLPRESTFTKMFGAR